jgi:putative thioredoxin
LIAKVEKNPSNLELRYQLAQLQHKEARYSDVIESCLQLIAIDRNWNNKAANQLLMEVFAKLGSANELVVKGRKKLSKILF